MDYLLGDESLKGTKALPNGAATIYSDGLDTKNSASGSFIAGCSLKISSPALTVAQLADTNTVKYSVQMDSDSAFGSATTIMTDVLTVTGSGGAGAAATSVSVRLPVKVERYVRLMVVKSHSGNASTVSLTEQLLT